MTSVSDWLLALWIMMIGADRIDLLGGRGTFVLTPYLALTPIVIVSELIRHHRSGRALTLSRGALVYALVTAALVTVVLFSVMDALDVEVSSARALLLVAEIGGTLTVVLLSSGSPHVAGVLARGAAASLILFAIFDVAEAVWWIGHGPETTRFGTILVHFGALQNVGLVPRLAGPVSDANRGGFVLLFYGLLISVGERRRVLRRFALGLALLFLILTMSRSAWLGAVAMMVAMMMTRRPERVPRGLIVTGLLAVVGGAVLFLAKPGVLERAVSVVASPIAPRLSANEGSAHGHLTLIERGVDEATQSLPNALVGLGYGNSHLVLQDVFPGNKYGNFHSMYVSMFAESGVLALLLTLVLLLTPVFAGGPWRPLIAGAAVFNVFYQTPTEPAFWFALAAAWMTMPSRAQRMAAPLPVGAVAPRATVSS